MALLLGGCAGKSAVPDATTAPQRASGTQALYASAHSAAIEPLAPDETFARAAVSFSLSLLKNDIAANETDILSPYSVLTALAMTANGADGNTLAQMEQVLGLPAPELNRYLCANVQQQGDELVTANSVWFANGCGVSDEFLSLLADCYKADAFAADFNEQTIDDANAWVSDHTDGRIPTLLDRLEPNTIMLLLNALTFDAEWETPFEAERTGDASFTTADGMEQTVSMMHGRAPVYLEDDLCTGFEKPYSGGRYRMIALLPKTDLRTLLDGLDTERWFALLDGAEDASVEVAMPRLSLETSRMLRNTLSAMGMPDAFDAGKADLSRLCSASAYIGQVVHKTFLTVDEDGTQAAAATAVEIMEKAIHWEGRQIVLNRPFLLAIVDSQTGLPVFLGTVNEITKG